MIIKYLKHKMPAAILFLWMICFALSGCGSQTTDQVSGPGEYYIYYMNSGMTKLVPKVYRTDETDCSRLIEELLHELKTVPAEADCQSALSDKVELLKYKKENTVLYLYFDNNYSNNTNMKSAREILCRSAYVKTLTQIPGIDFVTIYVGDQPLLDSMGTPVGMMSETDFIDSISDVNAYEKKEIKLYFTDETGTILIPETRSVIHNMNTSLEKLVVEQIISGPFTEGICPTLTFDTKLLNVSVNENVCYLNFDDSFLNNTLEVKEYIPIYSIVNSLCELSTVNKVQISINGSQDVMFRDNLSLNTLFERKLDIEEK